MRWKLLAVVGVVLLLASACGTEDSEPEAAEVLTMNVSAVDDGEGAGYSFEHPGSVPAGATRLSLANTGGEPHHAQLFKLDADATMADVGGALATGDPFALLEVGTFDGGTGVVVPAATSTADAIVDLAEGTYAFMCFVENADDVPHVAAGMLTSFEVTASDDAPALPETHDSVDLLDVGDDYAFDLPDTIGTDDILTIVNRSEAELHELNAFLLDEGSSVEDVVDFFFGEGPEGPPPFTAVGGMQALMPGAEGTLQLALEPGTYAFACLIPDPEGVPHGAQGMVAEVEIG